MKKRFFRTAFVCLFAVVALCSCNKDDNNGNNGSTSVIVNNTITATVEYGSSYKDKVDSVIAIIDGNNYKTANSVYNDGKFTLKLLSPIGDTLLGKFFNDSIPAGVIESDTTVKTGDVHIHAHKAGKRSGTFYHGTTEWTSRLVYSNKNVTITGSTTRDDKHTEKYDVNLKKGWNIVYEKDIDKGDSEITTQMPDNAKWYYEDYKGN
jgi:hypothetical protein